MARYTPPTLRPTVVVVLVLVAASLPLLRAADWWEVSDRRGFSVLLLQLDVPLRAWAVMLGAAGGGLVLAVAVRRHFLVWLAHAVLAAVYAGLLVTVGVAVLRLGTGFFQVVPFLGGAAFHGIFAATTRARPPRPPRCTDSPPQPVSEDPHGG